MRGDVLLTVSGLKTWIDAEPGPVRAVDGLDLEIRRGETFAVVGEPTSMQVVHVTKGSLWATLRTSGKAAHKLDAETEDFNRERRRAALPRSAGGGG